MQHAIIGYLFWKWFFYVAEEEKISRKNTSVLCIFPNQIMSRQSIYSDRSRMTYHVTQLLWIQWINWMTILVLITSRSWIMEFYQLFLILLETLPRLESQQTSTRWRLFSWMVVQILWHYILAETWKADFYYTSIHKFPCWYNFDRRDNLFCPLLMEGHVQGRTETLLK